MRPAAEDAGPPAPAGSPTSSGAANRTGRSAIEERSAPPALDFGSTAYTSIGPTLDYLHDVLDASIYVEDPRGRLLYGSARCRPDLWREDFTPFSAPSHPRAGGHLARWRHELETCQAQSVGLGLRESRLVFPLTYQGDVLALVHVAGPASCPGLAYFEDPGFIKAVSDKLYIVIVGTMNAVRRTRLTEGDGEEPDPTAPPTLRRPRYRVMTIGFGDIPDDEFRHSLLDYASIAGDHAGTLAAQLGAVTGDVARGLEAPALQVLARDDRGRHPLDIPVLLREEDAQDGAETDWRAACRTALDQLRWGVGIGISPVFTDRTELGERIGQADHIRALGAQQGPGGVYTQQDIGIEALLLPLRQSRELRQYSEDIVSRLERRDRHLLPTLLTYLRRDCNATRTAEDLGVDRRTVTYRLERTAEATGMDLGSLEHRVMLYLAFTSLDLL